jgi:hypothetical protein
MSKVLLLLVLAACSVTTLGTPPCNRGGRGPRGMPGPGSEFDYSQTIFVDTNTGNDANVGTNVQAPVKTLTRALQSIDALGPPSAARRFGIVLFAGTTIADGNAPITWSNWVNLQGVGSPIVVQPILVTGDAEVTVVSFTGVVFAFGVLIDLHPAFSPDMDEQQSMVLIVDCFANVVRFSGVWQTNSSVEYHYYEPVSEALVSLELFNNIITQFIFNSTGGVVFATGNTFVDMVYLGFFLPASDDSHGLIQNFALVNLAGGFVQASQVTLVGGVTLDTRGVSNSATQTVGIRLEAGAYPIWLTDSSSLPFTSTVPRVGGLFTGSLLSGTILIAQTETAVISIIGEPFIDMKALDEVFALATVTTFVIDMAATSVLFKLLPTTPYEDPGGDSVSMMWREITIKKAGHENPAYNLTIIPGGSGDSIDEVQQNYTLYAKNSFVGLVAAPGNWFVIRQSRVP